MLIEQLIDLRKVKIENLNFSTGLEPGLRHRVMDRWYWQQHIF